MHTTTEKFLLLASATALLALAPASMPFADEEDAANLQSYSVGDRRSRADDDEEKIVIERPKFENNFKFEAPKPSFSGMKLAKPKLEVLSGPTQESAPVESAPARTAEAKPAPSQGGSTANTDRNSGGGETRQVKPLQMDPPSYPRDALRRGQEGYVVVEFTINSEGRAEDIDVMEADPRGVFENEARRAVSRWEFQPALRDGRPVSQRIRHTLEFVLDQ